MKTILVRLTAVFIVCILFISSCKKNENNPDVTNSDRLKKTMAWLENQPKFTTIVLNQPMENYRVDDKGNIVSPDIFLDRAGSGCYPFSNTIPFIESCRPGVIPWNKPLNITDIYFPSSFEIQSGYTYTVRYRNIGPWLSPSITVSWP